MRLSHLSAAAVLVALVAAMFVGLGSVSAQSSTHKIVSTTDTDFVIAEGGSITVQVEAIATPGTAVTAYVFGEIFGFVLTDGGSGDDTATYRHQAGGPTGDFTITATNAGQSVKQTLTVGDAGDNLGSVEVVLGTTNADETARGTGEETDKPETDTAPSGTPILIEVVAKNSRGKASNVSSESSLDVVVFAVGGRVASGDAATGSSPTSATGSSSNSNKVTFAVFAADAGRVEVFATATIGRVSKRTTESLFLSFSGGPDTISAGDVSGSLLAPASAGAPNTGVVSFEITSVDKAGITNSASDTAGDLLLDAGDITAGFKITNEDGDNVTSKFAVDRSAMKDTDVAATTTAGETAIDESKISDNAIAVVITPGTGTASGVAAGTYTATVTLDEGERNSVEVAFNVVGPLDSLTAVADTEIVEEDGEFTVTATLKDAHGLPVADGKEPVKADSTATPPVVAMANTDDDVTFSVIGGDLNVWGQDSTDKGQTVTKEVKDGMASATFYVTGESGKAIVLVRAGTKTARVTVMTAAPVEAEPEDAEPPSVSDCLSATSGYAVWTCEEPSDAATIFAWVSSRGATALHLHNGTAWVRYSVVDGQLVPGSTNFPVARFEQLFISY